MVNSISLAKFATVAIQITVAQAFVLPSLTHAIIKVGGRGGSKKKAHPSVFTTLCHPCERGRLAVEYCKTFLNCFLYLYCTNYYCTNTALTNTNSILQVLTAMDPDLLIELRILTQYSLQLSSNMKSTMCLLISFAHDWLFNLNQNLLFT